VETLEGDHAGLVPHDYLALNSIAILYSVCVQCIEYTVQSKTSAERKKVKCRLSPLNSLGPSTRLFVIYYSANALFWKIQLTSNQTIKVVEYEGYSDSALKLRWIIHIAIYQYIKYKETK
jgi:hypothetical protein